MSEAGYRLYGQAELERLEHILALRFVGFNLEQIKELLRGSSRPLVAALRMQRELIAQQKRRLESALAAVDEAERVLMRDETADVWGTLRTVIEAFKMQNDWDWTRTITRKKHSSKSRSTAATRRTSSSSKGSATGPRCSPRSRRPRRAASIRRATPRAHLPAAGARCWRSSRKATPRFNPA